jgi:hypothetical protein
MRQVEVMISLATVSIFGVGNAGIMIATIRKA